MTGIYFSPSTQEHNAGAIPGYIEETEMNQIADIAIPLLKFNGFDVYRNDRTKDHIAAKNESNALYLAKKIQAHFALHSNAGGGEGTVAFTSGSTNGRRLAESIYNEVAPLSPSKDRGVLVTSTFTEVVKTLAPATLLEVAFHDDKEDAEWIRANHQEIAEAICKGFCKYFGVTFKKPTDKEVLKVDGYLNKETIKALQKYFGTPQDGIISEPSMCIKELQRRLNKGEL